jgi:hypothetical protein
MRAPPLVGDLFGYSASAEVDGISAATVSGMLPKVALHQHYVARGLLSGSRQVQWGLNPYKVSRIQKWLCPLAHPELD